MTQSGYGFTSTLCLLFGTKVLNGELVFAQLSIKCALANLQNLSGLASVASRLS